MKICLNQYDPREKMSLMFIIRSDADSSTDCGSLGNHIFRFCFEFNNKIKEQIEEYLDYIKNEEESIIEKILIK